MSPIDLQATVQVNQTNLNASVGLSPNDVTPIGLPEAEGGSSSTLRLWSSLRVRQAIVAWWGLVSGAFGQSLVAAEDAAAGRGSLELGTAATTDADAYATAAQGALAEAALPAASPLLGGSVTALTVASNATTIDCSAGTRREYRLTIGATAGFTLNLADLPAGTDTGFEASVMITTTSIPATFAVAGTIAGGGAITAVETPGATLADSPFETGKVTELLIKKYAAGRASLTFVKALPTS